MDQCFMFNIYEEKFTKQIHVNGIQYIKAAAS